MSSTKRVDLYKAAPEIVKHVMGISKAAKRNAIEAGFEEGFVHLAVLRASQINQCAFCVRMHTRDALKAGVSSDKISLVAAWEESTGYFSDIERAALSLVEAITLISEGQVPDSVYDKAAAVLDETQIGAIEWLAIQINIWNRVAIAGRSLVSPDN